MSSERNSDSSKKVIPFAPNKTYRNEVRDDGDPVDRSDCRFCSTLQHTAQ